MDVSSLVLLIWDLPTQSQWSPLIYREQQWALEQVLLGVGFAGIFGHIQKRGVQVNSILLILSLSGPAFKADSHYLTGSGAPCNWWRGGY